MKKIRPLFDFDDMDDFSPDDEESLINSFLPQKRMRVLNDVKIEWMGYRRKQSLQEIINFIPEPGKSYHFLSDGTFHFYTVIPVFIELLGKIDEIYASTWMMSRGHAVEILKLIDQGLILRANFMTGHYFKNRTPDVYALLSGGLVERKQRYIASPNHAKVTLINTADNYITIEGSANFTANPRTEQYAMCNDRGLYEAHKAWMNEVYENATQ